MISIIIWELVPTDDSLTSINSS